MHAFSIFAACSLFFSLVVAQPKSKSPELPARTYILKEDGNHYHNGLLYVYDPFGNVAFTYQRVLTDQVHGDSKIYTTGQMGRSSLTLQSSDDTCASKTHYTGTDFGYDVVEYKLDPRGMKADRWSLELKTPTFNVKFELKRNYLSKNGKLYIAGSRTLIATFTTEVTYEHWLNPGKNGAVTYSMRLHPEAYTFFSGPREVYLVTLMTLNMNRVDICGL